MANYLQGDIILINFPFSDLSDTKLRPALIISNTKVNKTSDVILAQISSNISNDEFSFFIDKTKLTRPLANYCEVRCNKLFTADKSLIRQKISSLKDDNYESVYQIIDDIFKYEKRV